MKQRKHMLQHLEQFCFAAKPQQSRKWHVIHVTGGLGGPYLEHEDQEGNSTADVANKIAGDAVTGRGHESSRQVFKTPFGHVAALDTDDVYAVGDTEMHARAAHHHWQHDQDGYR